MNELYHNDLEILLVNAYRLLTELEQMAVQLWIDTNDDSFMRMFDNERMIFFIEILEIGRNS